MIVTTQAFRPDWASPPGDTITDILRERGISVLEFARLIEQTPESTEHLLEGRTAITIATARKLGQVLGASIQFWMSRDYQYRKAISRLDTSNESWLRELPLGDMIKFRWLSPAPRASHEVTACLSFFNLPSVDAWREAYAGLEQLALFRTSPSFDSRVASVAAWLRQGEIEAERIGCQPWDGERLRESLSFIRSLTRIKEPSRFIPELQKSCAQSGVAVVVVRVPNGCRASGAVRFLSPQKALLQLSFRYLTDDHFWFTVFHELGHLLLHRETLCHKVNWILEAPDQLSTFEDKGANQFAADTLIPPDLRSVLATVATYQRAVIRFAVRAGISPGIVVGQLQHVGRIRYDQMNNLKRRFRWDD